MNSHLKSKIEEMTPPKLPPEIEKLREDLVKKHTGPLLSGLVSRLAFLQEAEKLLYTAAEIFMKREDEHLKIIEMQRKYLDSLICHCDETVGFSCNVCYLIDQTDKMLKEEK